MAARARRRDASGGGSGADFDEEALRWVLFLGIGCVGVAAGLMHTVFARQAAKAIGWETSPFQYEVGFANLGVGLAAIYAAVHDSSEAWVTTSIHIREIFTERNFAPGNTVILISDLGAPVSALVLLLATNAI